MEKAALLQETPLLRTPITARLKALEGVADVSTLISRSVDIFTNLSQALSNHIVSLVPGQNKRVSEHTTSWADALGNAMAAYA